MDSNEQPWGLGAYIHLLEGTTGREYRVTGPRDVVAMRV